MCLSVSSDYFRLTHITIDCSKYLLLLNNANDNRLLSISINYYRVLSVSIGCYPTGCDRVTWTVSITIAYILFLSIIIACNRPGNDSRTPIIFWHYNTAYFVYYLFILTVRNLCLLNRSALTWRRLHCRQACDSVKQAPYIEGNMKSLRGFKQYRRTLVSADSVSTVSIVRGLLRSDKNWKIK